jgi:hypothetical protein
VPPPASSLAGTGRSGSEAESIKPSPSGRQEAPLVAAVGWLVLATVLEFLLGWFLPGIGSSLYNPLLAVLLVAIATCVGGWWLCGLRKRARGRGWGLWIIGSAVLVGAAWLNILLPFAILVLILVVELLWRRFPSLRGGDRQPNGQHVPKNKRAIPGTVTVFAVGSAVVFLAAAFWTVECVLPLRVESHSAALNHLAECALVSKPTCPRASTWTVPGLGEIPRSDITVLAPSEVQLGQTVGYMYAPGLSFGGIGSADFDCLRHLYGSWWEFEAQPSTASPSVGTCPWGLRFEVGP